MGEQAALNAEFPLARDHLSFPEFLDDGYEAYNNEAILIMFKELIDHASQVPNLDKIITVLLERMA